ncbi:MAG: FAD:protein FMN transferase [Fusobacteriaceae bacterium]|nr:FAD:protein FMN transferase [Fusobacteriaceae bacterium]MBN2837277.1 FAD:protein FMN transferase [Fusobacteriaceae bacterium]
MKKSSKILILLIFLFGLISCSKNSLVKYEEEKFLFGTSVKIVIYGKNKKDLENLVKDTFNYMSEIENKYNSRYKESIIYKLNQNPTQFIEMDNTLKDMLEESIKISEITNGKYDITIGPILDLWGFNDLSRTTLPTEEEISEKLKLVNYRDIQIENNKVRLKKIGERIDTGSFLKGYAIKKGKDYLVSKKVKNAMITAISSIETIGQKPENKPFKIGIQNPKKIGELLYTIDLNGKALGVSGDYQTIIELEGNKYHHLIDATTGRQSNYNSLVLVLGENSYKTDLYSTGLFMMKAEDILKYIKNDKTIDVFIVDKNGKEYFSEGIKKYMEKI